MKDRDHASKPVKKVKKTTLVIALVIGFLFSLIICVTGGAMGFGSLYPQINLVAKPFVCPSGKMSYTQQASQVGSATYHTARWYCSDEATARQTEIDPDSIFLFAGMFHGALIFAVLLLITYLYWNSSVGPAKNGGLRLW